MTTQEQQTREDELIEGIYQYWQENHNFTIERGPKAKLEVENESCFN